MTFEVAERRVERYGIEIAYWVFGEGAPLMLVTGLGTPAAQWGPLPTLLSEMGYQTIVVDNRDCGLSSGCDDFYTIADMADDAVAVLDKEGVDRTYLFGISMGGMIAQEILLNHPSKVTRAILMATTPGGAEHVSADPVFLSEIFGAAPDGDRVEWTKHILSELMGPGFGQRAPDLIERAAHVRVEFGSNEAQFARQWQAIMAFSSWDRLSRVQIPVMVIHGDADPLVPVGNGEKLAARIPGAELIKFPGVGHFVPMENPVDTLQLIQRFFPVKETAESAAP